MQFEYKRTYEKENIDYMTHPTLFLCAESLS